MKSLLILSLMLLALTGCGDLMGTKVVKKELDTSRFRADCELDINRFSLILHEPIAQDIRCLGANLNLFISIVENERPGYMSRKAFEAYLTNYRKDDISPDVISALKAIFKLNYLLTGDDVEYISKASVNKIVEFAIIFNAEAYKYFRTTFQDESAVTYKIHEYQRMEVKQAAIRIMQALDRVHNANGDKARTLDILELLTSFTTEETRPSIQKIKDVLFAKKILLGGEKTIITHREIETIIKSFPELTVLALDAVRYKYIDLNQKSLISIIQKNVHSLHRIVYGTGHRTNEQFFTMKEAITVVEMFISQDTFNVNKYYELIVAAKKVLMGGSSTVVTGGDFRKMVDHAEEVLQTGEAFHRMYEHFLVPLESKLGPLIINYEQNEHVFHDRKAEFKKFIRIVKDYRFMKGEFETAYYTREWWRNSDALFEIYLFEYLFEQAFSYKADPENPNDDWGAPGSASKNFSHHITDVKLLDLVKQFKHELVAMGLILPGRVASIADTVSLLGTLFQYQSSRVDEAVPVLDVNEATEFALSLITSTTMASELMEDYNDQCPANEIDQFGRISPKCFKENYFNNFCQKYKRSYPLLFDSIGGGKACEDIVMNEFNKAYLDVSIKAARSCNFYHDGTGKPTTEEIYYSEGDIMTILTAMMHIEATIIRWDKNRNNIMDPDEVEMAYTVYSPALDGFLEDKPAIIKKLKKKIYLYLIKNETIPNEESFGGILKFGKFLLSFNQKAPATRKTLAAILYNISEENAKIRKADGEKQWDCNLLKNPDSIPADYDPDKT